MQLGELLAIEADLLELGYRIIAVSPDRPSELFKTMEKNELTYSLLSDSTMAGAQALGIAVRFGKAKTLAYKIGGDDIEKSSGQDHNLVPVPSVFIVDQQGILRFAHTDPNHRKRIKTEEILQVSKQVLE